MDAGVGVDQDALGGESLGAVTGDRVTMIEVAMFGGLELNLPFIVEFRGDLAIGEMDSITARSRLATPSCLSGAVN